MSSVIHRRICSNNLSQSNHAWCRTRCSNEYRTEASRSECWVWVAADPWTAREEIARHYGRDDATFAKIVRETELTWNDSEVTCLLCLGEVKR